MRGEKLRKILGITVIALAMALVPSFASAALDDVNGPACADVIYPTDVQYTADKRAQAIVALAAASCKHVTYTLVVLDDTTTPTELARFSVAGDGSTQLFIDGQVQDDDNVVCAYLTTSVGNGHHVFDRAPDTGCSTDLTAGGSPGFSDFN